MSIEAGFRAILGGCIAQIQDNAIGVVQGADSENIHQMRMGLRRLRSALGLFARWIPCPPTLQQELGWLASELGIARDADVLAKSTLPKVLDICPHDAELLLLGEAVSMMACAKKQQAALAVASERYSRLMRHLADWLHTKDWRESLAESARKRLAQPLAGRATRILARRHEKLIAPGKRLSESSPEVRHAVRIAAKKARYATEFFQSFYPARRVSPYLKGLEALQDRLGWLNDAVVADQSLREIGARYPEVTRGAFFARGCLCAATQSDLPELGCLWRQFVALKPPWGHRK